MFGINAPLSQRQMPEDARKGIVEIVGDTTRQNPQGFEFFEFEPLFLVLFLIGDVEDVANHLSDAILRVNCLAGSANPAFTPIVGDEGQFKIIGLTLFNAAAEGVQNCLAIFRQITAETGRNEFISADRVTGLIPRGG